MRLLINLNKKHFIFILVGFLFFGALFFVIAQTPPNPGHIASNVWIEGYGGINLENWVVAANNLFIAHAGIMNSLQTGINNHETAIINLQDKTWTPSPIGSPYYSASFSSITSTHVIPTSIPTTAKEVLVYVHYVNQISPIEATIYTQPGFLNTYTFYKVISGSSDNIWLPVGLNSQNRVITVSAPGISNPGSIIQIIGYR